MMRSNVFCAACAEKLEDEVLLDRVQFSREQEVNRNTFVRNYICATFI
jgi:hypothetical protein